MAGDLGDYWRDVKEWGREQKALFARLGRPCVGCKAKEPDIEPPLLLPGQKCRSCGGRDPRKRNRKKRNRRPS